MPVRLVAPTFTLRRLIIALLALAFTVIVLCACAQTAALPASAPPAATLEELARRIPTFHSSPTQANFSAILGGFQRINQDRANALLMATFIVFATERFHLSSQGAPGSLPLTEFRSLSSAALLRWLDDPSNSPEKNDVLWMGFFTTGDTQYLDRLAAIATSCDPTRRSGGSGAVIDPAASSAAWSYTAHAAQWPEVHAHAERLAAAGLGFAKECLDYATAHPELMHH